MSNQLALTQEQKVFEVVDKYLNKDGINRELRCIHMAIKDTSRVITTPTGTYQISVKRVKDA
jgi:hypothetical protein